MNLEHDSRALFYRSPFGAVTTGTEITLRLAVSESGIPHYVRLYYIINGETKYLDMHYINTICSNSIYETQLTVPEKECLIWYYFKVKTDYNTMYYGNNMGNLGGMGQAMHSAPMHSFQITVYDKEYKTPEWFKNSVAYQIFVDRFYNPSKNGEFLNERSDIIKRKWGELPYYKAEQFGGKFLNNDFFGGNLEGVIEKLPYLEELGIGAIYLNPIFKAYSNHKYDTGDYKEIDPMFGDDKIFKKLCSEAKKHGIGIILDGVFNHTGSNSRYFNREGEYDDVGAYQSKNSKYYDWYRFSDYPDVYESWWGIATLPHIEEKSESYREYILNGKDSVVKHWLRYGASGWRLDVVDELPEFFVKELRTAVKSVDEDAVIIGEVWEDASNKVSYGEQREYFLGHSLDSVMNYPLRNALVDFALGNLDATGFDERIMSLKENYPKPAFYSLLNFLSSHDIERIYTVMGNVPEASSVGKDFQANYTLSGEIKVMAKARLRVIVALQMLLPGVPCVFYGDEAGIQGYADPFCRATYPWGNEDKEIQDWYKKFIGIRNSSDVYKKGDFEHVYMIGRTYGFMRSYAGRRYIILACFNPSGEMIRLDAARFGIFNLEGVLEDEHHETKSGIFTINMPSYSVKIFECK
ncbi:MAG: glycoside hydrolase family 13 protein [Oscillospiraceae bacterium]|nr:glycoside hydrolase family 13 protein [Oscillospiraceae bacterium]